MQIPGQKSVLALAIAQIEVSKYRYGPALTRLDQALPEVDASDQDTRVAMNRLRGVCLYQLNRVDEARAAYESVLAISSNDTQTLNNYAFLLLEQGENLEKAVELAEQASRQAPANGAVLDTLGWAQYKMGKIEEARLTLQRAVTLADLAASHFHLAVVLNDIAKDTDSSIVRRSLISRSRASLETALARAEAEGDERYQERAKKLMDEWNRSGEETSP